MKGLFDPVTDEETGEVGSISLGSSSTVQDKYKKNSY